MHVRALEGRAFVFHGCSGVRALFRGQDKGRFGFRPGQSIDGQAVDNCGREEEKIDQSNTCTT